MRATKGDRVIFILIIVLLLMGVGYAYLTTSLNINGSADVVGANWNVHFDNIQFDNESLCSFDIFPEIGVSGTDISYEVTLEEPGNYIKFDVDVVNEGSVDAMIGSINSTIDNQPISNLPDYLFYSITYPDGEEVGTNYLLEAGKSLTYTFLLKYRDDIDLTQLPTSDYTHNIHIDFDFVQGRIGTPSWTFDNVVYSNESYSVPSGGTIDDIDTWSLDPFSMEFNDAIPAYLKYNIVDNNISSTQVMIYWGNNSFQAINPGIENRVSNIELFMNHFGSEKCRSRYVSSLEQSAFVCAFDYKSAYNEVLVADDGSVGISYCSVCMAYSNGSSTCYVDVC